MEFILVAAAHFLALLSPGPDFFLIVQAAFRLPLRYSLSLCFGIAMANGVYLIFAIMGLAIVSQSSLVQQGLKYLGGGYLIFIGIMLLRAKRQTLAVKEDVGFMHRKTYPKQFYLGFLSGILNPKNAIFYLAIFSTMVSTDTTLMVRCLYGLWMVLAVFIWDAIVVVIVGAKGVRNRLGGGLYYIEKLSGVVLATFGVLLSFS
jgi:threonine/homoserine/homoserine lactone efflux protein